MTISSTPIGTNLQNRLNAFAASDAIQKLGGINSVAYQAVLSALKNSSTLTTEFNTAADSTNPATFSAFGVLDSTAHTGAEFKNSVLYLKISAIGTTLSEGDLVFQMGHEAQHGLNAAMMQDSKTDFMNGVTALADSSATQDYTNLLQTRQTQQANNESTAQIAGWNAYVNFVDTTTAAGTTPNYKTSYLSAYFFDANGNLNPNLTFNDDHTVTATPANIAAERNAFFYNSGASLGANGNESYPAYYAGNDVAYIANVAANAGKSSFTLNLAAMQIDSVQLQQDLVNNASNTRPITFTDSSTNSILTYALGGTGNLDINKPFIGVNGTGTTDTIYNRAGKLTTIANTEHNDATGIVTTTVDNYGTAGFPTSKIITEADAVTGFVKTTTTNSYDNSGSLATQIQATNNPTTGTTTTSTVNYNPGIAGGLCTFETKVTQTNSPGITLSDVNGTETVDGLIATANISGKGATVNANGAVITLADNTAAAVIGNTDTVTTVPGGAASVAYTGQGGIIDLSNSTVTLASGSSATINGAKYQQGAQSSEVLTFGANGSKTQDAQFSNGVETGELNFVNDVKINQLFFNSSGQKTADALFAPSGEQTDYRLFDNKGQMTQDQQFKNGLIVDAVNFTNGVKTDTAFYDANQHKTADAIFNTSGQQTDYRIFDGNGQLTQDQHFANGYIPDVDNFTNGVRTSVDHYNASQQKTSTDIYDANQHKTADAIFNTSGQQTDYRLFDGNGQLTQDQHFANGYIPDVDNFTNGVRTSVDHYNASQQKTSTDIYDANQHKTADAIFNTSGQQTDYRLFDGNGQLTQDQHFANGYIPDVDNFTNGVRTSVDHYNASQQKTSSDIYNASQQKTNDALFSPSGAQTDYRDFDGNGQMTRDQHFANGHVSDVDNFTNGVKTTVDHYDANQHKTSTDIYDANQHKTADAIFNASGQQTDYRLFDGAGQLTQDQEFKGGVVVDAINYNGGVKTNTAFYDPSGQMTQNQEFKNNVLFDVTNYYNGQATHTTFYSPDGKKTQDQQYSISGKVNGATNYTNGVKTNMVFYNGDGTVDGQEQYRSDGTVQYAAQYGSDGLLVADSTYNAAGQLAQDKEYRHGVLETTINYANGAETSRTNYNPDGTPVGSGGGTGTGPGTYNGPGSYAANLNANGIYPGAPTYSVTPMPDSDGGTGGDSGGWGFTGIPCFGTDPIILNLQGQKVQTSSLSNSSAYFDMQNNGQKVQTGWATAGEGMLVYDPNNTGTVTSDVDLVAGFGALSALAHQSSGVLDAGNSLWSKLKVWVDPTGEANFQQGKLESLDQLGITSINLNSIATNIDNNGNTILNDSTFTWRNGSIGDVAGVNLAFNPTAVAQPSTVNSNPNVASASSLNHLIQSMAAFTDGNTGIDPTFSPTSANADAFQLASSHVVRHA